MMMMIMDVTKMTLILIVHDENHNYVIEHID